MFVIPIKILLTLHTYLRNTYVLDRWTQTTWYIRVFFYISWHFWIYNFVATNYKLSWLIFLTFYTIYWSFTFRHKVLNSLKVKKLKASDASVCFSSSVYHRKHTSTYYVLMLSAIIPFRPSDLRLWNVEFFY